MVNPETMGQYMVLYIQIIYISNFRKPYSLVWVVEVASAGLT